ncbi:MAG: hypothetical protein ISS82_01700 [Nanoarchaeota archaeon]|nr:hypothetical protein [Nanoarchaeota archaeon]
MNIFPRYQNKEIKSTKNASEEIWHLKKDLWDVLNILERGYDCSRSKRKANILEKCIKKGNNVFKAVVADCGDYFLLIHFGKFSYKKR